MRARVFPVVILYLALLTCIGCGRSEVIVSDHPDQSQTWLVSEIDSQYTEDFAFRYPVRNATSQRSTFQVRSIGCACYKVSHESAQLKIGDQFTLESGGKTVLELHPPRPRSTESGSYNFSVEVQGLPGKAPPVLQFTAFLRTVRDIQVNSSVIMQEFAEEETSQKARLEVTLNSRTREDVDSPPLVAGWPTGSEPDPIEALGPAVESEGIWKRTYLCAATIPRPDFAQGDIRHSVTIRGRADVPPFQLQLVQRSRTGVGGPSLVHFGEAKVGHAVSRRIQLSARDERPFQIVQDTEFPSVSLTPDEQKPLSRHWVRMTWTPQEPGELQQILRVQTDHSKSSAVEIEIRGVATP